MKRAAPLLQSLSEHIFIFDLDRQTIIQNLRAVLSYYIRCGLERTLAESTDQDTFWS
jgi:hypothetical protein